MDGLGHCIGVGTGLGIGVGFGVGIGICNGQRGCANPSRPESMAHVKSGKLRALVIASKERHALLPDVPTTAEAGLPALAVENWTAVMAPAATPDAVVARIATELLAIMASADIAERARTQGFRVHARGPRDLAPFVKDEIERWARIITSARITAS